MADQSTKKKDQKNGPLMSGIMILGIGLIFLLSNLRIIPDLGKTWPLFLIVIGVSLVMRALRKEHAQESSAATVTPIARPPLNNPDSPI